MFEELKGELFTPDVEQCKLNAIGATGIALKQSGGEEGRGREMYSVSFKQVLLMKGWGWP